MQDYDDRFFCVCCGQLMERKEAEILFRTGYFRVVHQLGCCIACEQKQSHAMELPDHERLRSSRNAVLRPLSAGSAIEGRAAALPSLTTRFDRDSEEEQSFTTPLYH